MFGIENFPLFLIAAFVVTITPGVDTVLVLSRAISDGRKAGVSSVLGITAGILCHTALGALGLSMIVAKSAIAFSVIKYAGAAYLVYLGVKTLMSETEGQTFKSADGFECSARGHFRTGLLTNVLNPKIALFFLAFFPQFIRKEALETPLPFIVLGLTHAVVGMLWLMALTYFSWWIAGKLTQTPKFDTYLKKVSGAFFILMGLKVAFSRR